MLVLSVRGGAALPVSTSPCLAIIAVRALLLTPSAAKITSALTQLASALTAPACSERSSTRNDESSKLMSHTSLERCRVTASEPSAPATSDFCSAER